MKCKNDFMIRIPYNSFDYYKESIENKENLSLDKFKENLLISSSGLYDIISKKEKINNDELISLTKYLIRSSTRCTPYGLNSSVMIGNFKEDNILNIHKKHHKKSRPDMSWLIEIIKKLEKDVGIKLKVIINDTNRFVGEKVLKKWNSCYVKNARESERKIYINNTKAVKYVFDMCKQYISIEDIIKNLKSNSIGVKEESIIEFISSLLDNEFLISDLRPNTLITDPLGYVLEKLEGYNVNTELFCKLLELRSMLDNYEKTDIGEGEEIYKNIINFMENILIVGAHPDDIELGCIGSLMKLKKEGKKIVYLVMTNGGNWEKKTYKDRVDEIKKALIHIDVDEVIVGAIQDGYLKHDPDTIDFLSNIIKKYSIDTVLCQYYKDTHQDHVNLGLNTLSIATSCKNLIFYESLTSTEFVPNYYIDISKYEIDKKNVLKEYVSQIEKYKNRNQDLLSYIDAKDKINGIKSHVDYAEGFIINKMVQ